MRTLCLPADSASIAQAAQLLRAGEIVGFPTETVYGLGANALSDPAVRKIFAAKERPADNPLIVHIAALADMEPLCHINDMARRLAAAFWPGPLTMILPKKDIVPAVVTAMLGMFTGEFVRRQDLSGGRKASWMIAAAVALLVAGLAFNGVVPVNKSLWSSTFVCVVAAYSLAMFALFYYLIDVRGWRRWTLFFRVVGLNSITIYLAQRIVGFGRISDFFLGGVASKCPEALAAVVNSAGYVAVCWLFLYFLYRKNVFLKV